MSGHIWSPTYFVPRTTVQCPKYQYSAPRTTVQCLIHQLLCPPRSALNTIGVLHQCPPLHQCPKHQILCPTQHRAVLSTPNTTPYVPLCSALLVSCPKKYCTALCSACPKHQHSVPRNTVQCPIHQILRPTHQYAVLYTSAGGAALQRNRSDVTLFLAK